MSNKIRSVNDTYLASVVNMNKIYPAISDVMANPDKYELSKDHVNTIMSEIKSKITSYGKVQIVDDIAKGYTKLVLVPDATTFTAWVTPATDGDNGYRSYANIFNKVRIKDQYVITFQVREIFGYLMYAYVNRKYIENTRKIQLNSQLTSNCAIVYTRMMMRVIDALFATSSIPVQSASISYCVAKFFIRYVLGREISPDLEDDICYNVAKRQADVTHKVVKEFTDNIPDSAFENTKVFFETLASTFSTVNGMDVNLIMRKFITTYGEKSLFMIEVFQAFLGYTITSTYSSGLIRDYAFENVSGKEGNAIASIFLNAVR